MFVQETNDGIEIRIGNECEILDSDETYGFMVFIQKIVKRELKTFLTK